MKSRHTADDHQYGNLTNWMTSYPEGILPNEKRFKDYRGDLISIVEKPQTPIGSLLGRWRMFRLSNIFRPRIFKDHHIQSDTTIYHSSRGQDAMTGGVIVIFGLCLVFGPLWWLNWITDPTKKLGIITGFVLLFATLLMGSTVNRPFEVLAGTAA
jgi:hypothetical protein